MVKGHGGNCLYAKRGVCGLRKSEVIFFDEDAMVIKYLFEFET